jgi:hypothetical protein
MGMAGAQGEGGGRRTQREARLANKLRQNLVRRKAKTRAMRDAANAGAGEATTQHHDVRGRSADECES